MSWRLRISLGVLVLSSAACSGGGLNYWLYPEPHLPETEEAVFLAHEDHRVQFIDEERTDELCWGASREHQAYRQRKPLCRLHLKPGKHVAVIQTAGNSMEADRVRVEFDVVAGKTYGIKKTGCFGGLDGARQTCLIEVIEVADPSLFR